MRTAANKHITSRYGIRLSRLECGHTHLAVSAGMPGGKGRSGRAPIGAYVMCSDCRTYGDPRESSTQHD